MLFQFSIRSAAEAKGLFGCFFFVTQFSSFVTHHSSFVTYHLSLIILKYPTHLVPLLTCHHSIFFTLFVGSIPVTRCNFYFSNTQTHWTQKKGKKMNPVKEEKKERKKERKNPTNGEQWKKKKKEKKKKERTQPTETVKKKEKKMVKSCS